MSTDESKPSGDRHFLDGPGARIAASAVFVIAAAYLVFLHDWEDATQVPSASDDPAAAAYLACVSKAYRVIDEMAAETGLAGEQAALFKQRADGRCRDETK